MISCTFHIPGCGRGTFYLGTIVFKPGSGNKYKTYHSDDDLDLKYVDKYELFVLDRLLLPDQYRFKIVLTPCGTLSF